MSGGDIWPTSKPDFMWILLMLTEINIVSRRIGLLLSLLSLVCSPFVWAGGLLLWLPFVALFFVAIGSGALYVEAYDRRQASDPLSLFWGVFSPLCVCPAYSCVQIIAIKCMLFTRQAGHTPTAAALSDMSGVVPSAMLREGIVSRQKQITRAFEGFQVCCCSLVCGVMSHSEAHTPFAGPTVCGCCA